MDDKTRQYILDMSMQENRFGALYRYLAASFGISACGMWVLYYLFIAEDDISQQELMQLMMFPKQTINSAVTGLVKKGYVELEMIPGTRNRKKIILTKAGRSFAKDTVCRLQSAESRALGQMGDKKMKQYIALHDEYLALLTEEFSEEGLISDEYKQE